LLSGYGVIWVITRPERRPSKGLPPGRIDSQQQAVRGKEAAALNPVSAAKRHQKQPNEKRIDPKDRRKA
jgi:hypothetical protein